MPKKQHFLIVDTETTVNDTVADFGAVVCDRKGIVAAQCAVMVADVFPATELFYKPNDSGFWGKAAAATRAARYMDMLNAGSRMLASSAAINRWLEKVAGKYSPTLTAYNLAFDIDKCSKTNIDLSMFASRFCLWAAASATICQSKAYKNFCAANHLFNPPTEHGNMTYKTNAECVAGYLAGQFTTEPHTALEDALYFELPILTAIVKRKNWKDKIQPYAWANFQVKDHFQAK